MKKAVIYARTSSSGAQENRQNTTRQVMDLQQYACANKLDVLQVFEEHISGAKKNFERPVLTECIEFCKNNNVDLLCTSELSRLGRNAFQVLSTVQDLMESGINVYMRRTRQTLWEECTDANPKLSLNDT